MDGETVQLKASAEEVKSAQQNSCFACIFGLIRFMVYALAALLILAVLVFTNAGASLFAAASLCLAAAFIWQSLAARRGCVMPFLIFFMFLASEIVVISLSFYHADPKSQNMTELRLFLDQHVPGLYQTVSQAARSVAEKSGRLVDSGLDTLKSLTVFGPEKRIAELEEQFQKNPGDAETVLALADAYMAEGDIASVRFATALYEALVEVSPCDSFLAKLADAYCLAHRSDKAFSTAIQRCWLPHANYGRIAAQISLIAIQCQNLPRGIIELEKILQTDPVESEEIILLLASLCFDNGESGRAEKWLEVIFETVPAETAVYKEALRLKDSMVK